MQVAVIGLGGIAKKGYLPVLTAVDGLDLMLMSRTPETVQSVQSQYRVARGATSLDEVLRAKPQAAFVLTPRGTHFEIVRALLDAEIDVFLEKPATEHSEETRALAELAEKRERVLMVGFNRRYAPLHRQARELWGERTVSLAQFQKVRASPSSKSLMDQFIEDTIHQIDLLRYFCGEGEVVSTQCEMREGRVQGAVSTVALERGGLAQVVTSMRGGAWQETYALHGGGLSMTIDAFLALRAREGASEQMWRETYDSTWRTTLEGRGFAGQIEHFFDCVRERKPPETDAWDSVKTQRLLEAMVAKVGG